MTSAEDQDGLIARLTKEVGELAEKNRELSARLDELRTAQKLRAQIPSSTDPERLERMAQEAESGPRQPEPLARCYRCGKESPLDRGVYPRPWCFDQDCAWGRDDPMAETPKALHEAPSALKDGDRLADGSIVRLLHCSLCNTDFLSADGGRNHAPYCAAGRDDQRRRLAIFASWVIRAAWDDSEIEHAEIQDRAEKLGLIVSVEGGYDPDKHGDDDFAEPGDPYFELVAWLKRLDYGNATGT